MAQPGSAARATGPVGAPPAVLAPSPPQPAPATDAPGSLGAWARAASRTGGSLRGTVAAVAGVLVLSLTSAFVVSALQPTTYGAQAEVYYEVTGSSQEADLQLATQQVLLGSRGVLEPVADTYGITLAELSESQQVERVGDSQVLRLLVTGTDAGLTVQLAQDIVDSYVQTVSADAGGAQDAGREQALQQRIAELATVAAADRARLDELSEQRAQAVAAGRELDVSGEEQHLQARQQRLREQIATAQADLTRIGVARQIGGDARVLTPAYALDKPLGPNPVRAAAAGLIAGLLLSAAVIAYRTRSRRGPGLQ